MQGDFAHRLITLENMWGSEATCTAIEMAHENEVNNINYIAAILKNSNGRPMRGKRKEDKYNGYPNFEPTLTACYGVNQNTNPIFSETVKENRDCGISATPEKVFSRRIMEGGAFSDHDGLFASDIIFEG